MFDKCRVLCLAHKKCHILVYVTMYVCKICTTQYHYNYGHFSALIFIGHSKTIPYLISLSMRSIHNYIVVSKCTYILQVLTLAIIFKIIFHLMLHQCNKSMCIPSLTTNGTCVRQYVHTYVHACSLHNIR